MGWCGNVISSYVNYDGKDAYINVLVCYGWGLATSISNILINQKPISSFQNCTYFTRLGTNTQPAIDGFDKTVNGYPQEIDLLVADGPVVVPGTGTNIQGLEITVKFPAGLYRVTNDGNYVPLKFIYLIEVSPHGADTWTSPLFPNAVTTPATTHMDGSQTWPAWCVIPTDRFAGSGIVYATDNGSHTPGDAWSSTETVTITNLDTSTTTTSATFTGQWQPLDPNTAPALVTSWYQGYRIVENDTLSALFDEVSIYGLTPGQWDTRLTKIGYCQDNNNDVIYSDSTDAKHVADGWLWNINEVFWSNLTYPNMILVGVKALATSQMSGTDIQVQATIVHDLGADTTLPAALSGYDHDNPAIVAYDVLTNPLYGMNVAASLIDVPAFVAWADFCDESVTNQGLMCAAWSAIAAYAKGDTAGYDGYNWQAVAPITGTAPSTSHADQWVQLGATGTTTARRFVFAGVFDQAGDAWKVLSTIGAMSRASVIQIGMRYSVVLDAPADPVQLFTVGNTKKDSFTETWLSLDDRCTLIECDFADAARNYRMDLPVSVMTEANINSGLQPKITRTKLVGCTDRDQAWRWAYFHLLSTTLTLRTIQITAAIESVACQIGSVIAVQSDVTQWAVGGRILAGSTTYAVNVDRTDLTWAADAGWTVSVQHPVVQRGTATVSSISGLTVTMTGSLPSGRILKAVGPDGTEYVVTGYTGTSITVETLTPQAATVALAVTDVVTLYDIDVIENFEVTGMTVTPAGPNSLGSALLSIAGSGAFSAVPTADCAWAYGQSNSTQPAKLFRVLTIKKSGDFNFDIGAAEYNPSIYTDVIPSYGEIVNIPSTDAVILNLSITEQYQNGILTGSTNSAIVAIGWQNGNAGVGAQMGPIQRRRGQQRMEAAWRGHRHRLYLRRHHRRDLQPETLWHRLERQHRHHARDRIYRRGGLNLSAAQRHRILRLRGRAARLTSDGQQYREPITTRSAGRPLSPR